MNTQMNTEIKNIANIYNQCRKQWDSTIAPLDLFLTVKKWIIIVFARLNQLHKEVYLLLGLFG